MNQRYQFSETFHSDRDNLATILAMAAYVTVALEDAADDQAAGRLARLRACLAEAKKNKMFYDDFDPVVDKMINTVQAARAGRIEEDFVAASARLVQEPMQIVPEPTPSMLAAGARAAGVSAAVARKVFDAMMAAIGSSR